jgi:hypothetical protein
VGRALRLLIGLAVLVQVTPVYVREDPHLAINSLVLMLGLLVVYSLLHIAQSRHLIVLSPLLGAVVGLAVLVSLYLAGSTQAAVVGYGAGQIAAFTFFGVSLVVAAVRADPGCEVMAIPDVLLRRRVELACLFFSPLDAWERRWRSRRAA